MVLTRSLISKSSCPCISPLVTVPRAPIIVGIIVSFMFYSIFISLDRSRYYSFFGGFFSILLNGSLRQQSPQLCKLSFSCWLLLGLVVWLRLVHPFVSQKSEKSLFVSFSRTDSELCIYNLFVRLNFNFWRNYQWITLSIQSYLVLYSFYANLLHSLILW